MRWGGLNGCATKEIRTFFKNVRGTVPMATKPRGGGAKALSGRPTKKTFFLAATLEFQSYNWNTS